MYSVHVAEARAAAREVEAARELAQDEDARAAVCLEAHGRAPSELARRARRRMQKWVDGKRAESAAQILRTAAAQPPDDVDAMPTEGGFRVVKKSKHRGPYFLSSHHASTSRAYYRGGGELDEERSGSLRKTHAEIRAHSIDLPPSPLDVAPSRHPVHHCFRDRDPQRDLGGLWKATPLVAHEPAISQLSPRKHPSHFFKSEWRPEGPPFSTAVDFDIYARPKTSHGDERRDRRRLCQIVASNQLEMEEALREEELLNPSRATRDLQHVKQELQALRTEGSAVSRGSHASRVRKSLSRKSLNRNQNQDRDSREDGAAKPMSSPSLRDLASLGQARAQTAGASSGVFSSSFPRRRLSELEVRPRSAFQPSTASQSRKRLYSVTIRSIDLPQATTTKT